jgi:hypothetical protein
MSRLHLSHDTTANLQSTVMPQPVFSKSVFSHHLLRPADIQSSRLREMQPDWILAILLACFILIAWVRFFHNKRFQQVIRAPFSRRFINQLIRDGNLFREQITIALGIVYVLTFSLFLYASNELVFHFTFPGIGGLLLYLLIAAMTLGLLSAKVALVQLLGAIFKTRETTTNYLLNLFIFALLTGPVLLAALVFAVYLNSSAVLFAAVALFIILMIFRFMRGFFIGMALTKFSYLFLFVYLCSLEILPLLVLLKILLIITNTAGA